METVQLNERMNTGLWQYFSVEFGAGQVRVAVNKAEFVFELHEWKNDVETLEEAPLHVGGRPG
jgi:hypothetical protein